MTEQEWLTCTDPTQMLDFLQDKASDRKLRLFAVACCRIAFDLSIVSEKCQQAVIVIEHYADGKATGEQLKSAGDMALSGIKFWDRAIMTVAEATDVSAMLAAEWCQKCCLEAAHDTVRFWQMGKRYRRNLQLQLQSLRDIFGSLFRPVTIDPRWLSSTVIDLAQVIYDERAFDRLPILGDALLDAGCDEEALIAHCREAEGVHARGCWVVDVVLGKS